MLTPTTRVALDDRDLQAKLRAAHGGDVPARAGPNDTYVDFVLSHRLHLDLERRVIARAHSPFSNRDSPGIVAERSGSPGKPGDLCR